MAIPRSVLTSTVIALSLLSLAACAQTPVGAETATPTATTSPTASADPAGDEPTVPNQVFGGDCAAVLSVDDAGTVLGTTASAQSVMASLLPFSQSARDVGGLNCGWDSADESVPAGLRVTILPAEAVGEQAVTEDNYCDVLPGEGECLFSVVEQGWWFSGTMLPLTTSSVDTINAQVGTLTSLFVTAASAAESADDFAPATPLDGEWSGDVDCSALAQVVDAAALLNQPGVTLAADAPVGAIEAPPGYFAAGDAAGFTGCTWFGTAGDGGTESQGIFAYYLAGGTWIEAEVAALPGAQELSGDGIDRAYLVTDPALSAGRAGVLHVFDGVNWLAITGGPASIDESYLPFASALIAERNTAN